MKEITLKDNIIAIITKSGNIEIGNENWNFSTNKMPMFISFYNDYRNIVWDNFVVIGVPVKIAKRFEELLNCSRKKMNV